MRRLFLVLVLVACVAASISLLVVHLQRPASTFGGGMKVRSLTIYDVDPRRRPSDARALESVSSKVIEDAAVIAALTRATYRRGLLVTHGILLAIAHMENGDEIRLLMSLDGSFFLVQGERGYYVVSDADFQQVNKVMRSVIVDDFIPIRLGGRQLLTSQPTK